MSTRPSGYSVTVEEFRQLVRQLAPRALNQQVLHRVGLRLSSGTIKATAEDRAISVDEAHAIIQQDERAKRALYQLAMDLWR